MIIYEKSTNRKLNNSMDILLPLKHAWNRIIYYIGPSSARVNCTHSWCGWSVAFCDCVVKGAFAGVRLVLRTLSLCFQPCNTFVLTAKSVCPTHNKHFRWSLTVHALHKHFVNPFNLNNGHTNQHVKEYYLFYAILCLSISHFLRDIST